MIANHILLCIQIFYAVIRPAIISAVLQLTAILDVGSKSVMRSRNDIIYFYVEVKLGAGPSRVLLYNSAPWKKLTAKHNWFCEQKTNECLATSTPSKRTSEALNSLKQGFQEARV